MPELPEVETVVRGLRPSLVGKTLGQALAPWPKVIEPWDLSAFNAALAGRKIAGLSRRGKYICCDCEGYWIVIHLRMTGRLYLHEQPEGLDAWVRFAIALGEDYLIFSDARKFGRVTLVTSLDFLEEKLGPEPLELEAKVLGAQFQRSARPIKTFLLDQKQVAGVGNIYADEALFRAGILPTRPVSALKPRERTKLAEQVQAVLRQGIQHEGATIGWYRKPDGSEGESQKHFLVYGRGGEPCLTCGTDITRIELGQRGTHFCRKCQH